MRSLFLRIFMSYWLATGLVLASAVGTTSWVASERARMLEELEPAELVKSALQALISKGQPGLAAWEKAQNSGILAPNVYVVDGSGADLIGRTLSPQMLRRAQLAELAMRLGRSWSRPPRFAALIADSSGNNYMLVVTSSSGAIGALGNFRVLGWLLLVALTVSGLVCWVVARSITKPVIRLHAGVRALARGDLRARSGAGVGKRHDELGALARDFDLMAEKLRLMISSKESLMRDLSHELRSPLARLRIALGLARFNPESVEKQFARIELEAERMDLLIGQLLRLSRLMNVERQPQWAMVDLSELLSEIVEDARLEAEGTRKRIEWHDPGAMEVQLDAEIIRHAVENVVRNALRFSPDDGVIEVSLTHRHETGRHEAGRPEQGRQDEAVIVVTDQGPGVPEDELVKIFEPFYRAQHNSGGTGIGLAITRQAVSLHDGEVRAYNRPEQGFAVEFRLKMLQKHHVVKSN